MSTARSYDRIIRRHLLRRAAWLPVLTPFKLGDYGFYRGGVFQTIGNIADLGVDFTTDPGGTVSLDFQTQGSTEVTFFVEGKGAVPQLPDSDVEARIEFAFARAFSFLLKAPAVRSTVMHDIAGVAAKLAAMPRSQWRLRYKLVTEVLEAEEATMVSTQTRNTTVSVHGKASVLRRLDLGQAAGGVTVTANRSLGLEIVGRKGTCALGLVKVRGSGIAMPEAKVAADGTPILFDTESADLHDETVEDDF